MKPEHAGSSSHRPLGFGSGSRAALLRHRRAHSVHTLLLYRVTVDP